MRILSKSFFSNLDKNAAVAVDCDAANFAHNHFSYVSSNYYKLSEEIYPFYDHFLARELNPFTKRIQDYVFRFFEAGLIEVFKKEYDDFLRQFRLKMRTVLNEEESVLLFDDIFLTFDDLFGTFKILLIGFSVASLAFILEWLWFFAVKYIRF